MRSKLDRWLMMNPLPSPNTSTVEERRNYFESMPPQVKRDWEICKAKRDCENDPKINAAIVNRAKRRMAFLDGLTREMRNVVYDHNLEIVREFIQMGITKPTTVRTLIEGVLAGGRTRLFNKHGIYVTKKIDHLIDTVLHREFPNGQPRFKTNKGPNAKQNPINLEVDNDEYYVIANAR